MLSQTPNLGWNAACWAHSICHHECGQQQWVPFLNISLRPRWEKTLPENYFPILRFSSKFALQRCFPYIPCYLIIPHYFLLIWLLLQYMSLFESMQLVRYFKNIVNWCRVTISRDKSWLFSLFCVFFFKLIAKHILCIVWFAFTASPMERDVEIDTVRERLINVITHSITIAADNLPTPVSRTSAAMLLTLFNLNLEFPASRKSTKNGHDKNQFMHACINVIWYPNQFPKCNWCYIYFVRFSDIKPTFTFRQTSW